MKLLTLALLVVVACVPFAWAQCQCDPANGQCDPDTDLCLPGSCRDGFGGDLCDTALLDFDQCPAGTTDAVIRALRAFYRNMGGSRWARRRGWNRPANRNPCTWYGVTCDPTNPCKITDIDLSNNRLRFPRGRDSIDFDSLAVVHSIKTLDLSDNGFGGELSPKIANMRSLETIYLGSNDMTGDIPDTISSMSLLKYVDMSNNNFTGSLPSFAGSADSLMYLYLQDNQLSGTWEDQLQDNEFMRSIWLSNNCMEGDLPDWLSLEVFPHLTELRVAHSGMAVDGISQELLEELDPLLVLTYGGEESCECPAPEED